MVRLRKNGKSIIFLRSSSRAHQKSCLQCKCCFDEGKFRRTLDSCGHIKCLGCVLKVREVCIQCVEFSETSKDSDSISSSSCCSWRPSPTAKPIETKIKPTIVSSGSGRHCGKSQIQRVQGSEAQRKCDQPKSSKNPESNMFISNRVGFLCYKCGRKFISRAVLKAHLPTHTNYAHKSTTRMSPIVRLPSHSIVTDQRRKEDVHQQEVWQVNESTAAVVGITRNKPKPTLPISKRSVSASSCDVPLPFSCGVCKKRFKLLLSLKSHMRVHTGNNLHLCNLCGKTFLSRSHLKRHVESHLVNNRKWAKCPFRCPRCGKGYQDNHSLNRHISKQRCKNSAQK